MADSCPHTFNCSYSEDLTSFDLGLVPSYISIVSSFLSCLGSVLILIAYAVVPKDARRGIQQVITLLAVADLFQALGYIVAGGNFIDHYNVSNTKHCKVFGIICEIQSFITAWFSLSSYIWTCILALYFYLMIVRHWTQQQAAKLIPLYNVVAWAGPLTLVLPLLLTGNLGFSPYGASNWCFVRDTGSSYQERIIVLAVAGPLWVMLTYVVIIVLYTTTRHRLYILKKRQYQLLPQQPAAAPAAAAANQIEKRLLYIPLVFIILRIWGTTQFFLSIAVSHNLEGSCVSRPIHGAFFALGILQAVGVGGQGWGNAVLYIFLSPTMRAKLFGETCTNVAQNCGRKLIAVGEKLLTFAGHEEESDNAGEHQQREETDSEEVPPVRRVRHPREVGRLRRPKSQSECSSVGPSEGSQPGPAAAPGPLSSAFLPTCDPIVEVVHSSSSPYS